MIISPASIGRYGRNELFGGGAGTKQYVERAFRTYDERTVKRVYSSTPDYYQLEILILSIFNELQGNYFNLSTESDTDPKRLPSLSIALFFYD